MSWLLITKSKGILRLVDNRSIMSKIKDGFDFESIIRNGFYEFKYEANENTTGSIFFNPDNGLYDPVDNSADAPHVIMRLLEKE